MQEIIKKIISSIFFFALINTNFDINSMNSPNICEICNIINSENLIKCENKKIVCKDCYHQITNCKTQLANNNKNKLCPIILITLISCYCIAGLPLLILLFNKNSIKN